MTDAVVDPEAVVMIGEGLAKESEIGFGQYGRIEDEEEEEEEEIEEEFDDLGLCEEGSEEEWLEDLPPLEDRF